MLTELRFAQDRFHMNWFRPDYPYAQVLCPDTLEAQVSHRQDGDLLYTEIVLTNRGGYPLFTSKDSIGIRFPLEDRYDSSQICMEKRCHAHIFCGGDVSYICALRMGANRLTWAWR